MSEQQRHSPRYVTLEAETAPQRLRIDAATMTTRGLPTRSITAPMNAETKNCATNTMLLTCKTATRSAIHPAYVQGERKPNQPHGRPQDFSRVNKLRVWRRKFPSGVQGDPRCVAPMTNWPLWRTLIFQQSVQIFAWNFTQLLHLDRRKQNEGKCKHTCKCRINNK